MKLNDKLFKIEKEDSFSKSTRLLKEYKASHPDADIVSLGIGDVSFPVPKAVTKAMEDACLDLSSMDSFQGYGAYWGIEALRRTIAKEDYKGLDISFEEVYVGDGTKTDSTAILELFDRDIRILTGNPSYPIYKNGAFALGRDVYEAECSADFKMTVPKEHFDVIYICSPCNPVGNAYTRDELSEWIRYANKEGAVIIYDNVYRDFIESPGVPMSIYELEGSRTCAIEMHSYSKNASFSGVRCSYFILPKEFGQDIHALWRERTINRFNGASYIAQRGAMACYLPEARKEIKERIASYKSNGYILRECLLSCGFTVTGGVDSPYLWVQTPDKMECWDAFDFFLKKLNIVVVPGAVFGSNGRHHIRISSLGSRLDCLRAIGRIKRYYEKDL